MKGQCPLKIEMGHTKSRDNRSATIRITSRQVLAATQKQLKYYCLLLIYFRYYCRLRSYKKGCFFFYSMYFSM